MFAFTLGVIVLTLIIYFPNYARLKKLRDENQRLSLDNQKLIAEIADYEEKLQRVGKDPYLYEKIAREELGIAKEGEIVIDIEE
jgi:cell division protein FtsB